MGDAQIDAPSWRRVEVGRVVLIQTGPYVGKLATIVEIIDHKRALIDGPSSNADRVVPRHAIGLSSVLLSPLVIENLPRAARNATVKAAWEKSEIDSKWEQSNWAKRMLQTERRKALSDFDRFKVMRLKKQRRFEERKALAKVKAAA